LIAGVDVVQVAREGLTHDLGLTAPWRFLTNPSSSISDNGTMIAIDGNGSLLAGGDIRIADTVRDEWVLDSGRLSAVSLGGGDVALGGLGRWHVASLGVASLHVGLGQPGDVSVMYDGDLLLTQAVLPNPDSRSLAIGAHQLTLRVDGSLSDTPGTPYRLNGAMRIEAAGSIALAQDAQSRLEVMGSSVIESQTGSIRMGNQGFVSMA
jgi:hypothetical protein